MKILVYVSWPVKAWSIPDAKVAELRERFPEIEFLHARTLDEARAVIGDVDAAFTPYLDSPAIAAAERLRWVHSSAAAVQGLLPLADLAARGIAVSNSRGIQAVAIAEHVMGGLLVLSRKYKEILTAQQEHRWIQNNLTNDWPWLLHGRRMSIVGLGTIGMEIAKRAHAFGMTVRGVRRRADGARPDFVERVFGTHQIDEAICAAEILVLSAPGVAATHGMIGSAQLAMLERGAILVNVARAQIVDGPAMLSALESGQLGGAVLDVFEREPLDAADPLWSMPNVVITPHSSGFRANHWDDVIEMFSENLVRFQTGKSLVNAVDPAAGY